MPTAWFNDNVLPDLMLNSGFKPLGVSDHFEALNKCMSQVQGKKLLDLGCGIGEAFETFSDFEYTGADLPHIIENASRKRSPGATFIHFNADNDSYEFLGQYDVVLMNSFISELPNWYWVLNNVLLHSTKDIVIHRQEVSDGPSKLEDYITYGGLPTIKCIINYKDLVKTCEINGYNLVDECNSFPHDSRQKTFLFRKEK